jgi:hypothetical protein
MPIPDTKNREPSQENETARIFFVCTPEEKNAWVNAAAGRKLTEWIREALNQKASIERPAAAGEKKI